ncbi:MAG TPA: amino acid ABC transporter substrate-binding protein [Burkholderiaceae bacterium]|nr:amino acid ABC transporter substrate-binding protein [Burkholderiaceae bacterium]
MTINRRDFVRTAGVAAAATTLAAPAIVRAQDRTSIKVGFAISKTGPFVGGASASQIPNYRLWTENVNKAGGIKLGDKRYPIELIEYDDRSQSEELVRATERLINQDKVDFLLPPWSTGFNMAVAPLYFRGDYPMIAPSFATDRMPELVKRWPNIFSLLDTATSYSEGIVALMNDLREKGEINNKVAVVNNTDQFGLELARAAKVALRRDNFDIVYDAGYPMSTQDVTPLIAAAQQGNPDSFLAFSYPPDTVALTEAARVRGFNPKVYYTGVGTALPLFPSQFGDAVQGVMGPGGWNPDTPAMQQYIKEHTELVGRGPDHWVSSLCYAGLQALAQATEKVGKIDRPAIIEELDKATFDTVVGPLKFNEDHIVADWWLVGQWQGDNFWGVYPTDRAGAKDVILKPKWKA